MKRSTDRILTTHTGSLPRPADLEAAMLASLEGAQHDPDDMTKLVRDGVAEVVRQQVEAGVDIVSDGEVGKTGYSTYVSERLEGFGGEAGPMVIQDFVDYPETAAWLADDPGFTHMQRSACVGPIAVRDGEAVHRDIALFQQAVAGVDNAQAFMTAVSPATISMFFENQHYPDQEPYLWALAEVMRPEYQAIIDSGLTLQIDCPDLGCGHVLYHGTAVDEVKRNLEMHIEVLNHALRDLPAEQMRMHVCWGNYAGPHHLDIPLRDIVHTVLKASPHGLLVEAANPRHDHEWQVWEDVALPEGKVLIPGVVDTTNNYIEHPELVAQRLVRYAEVVGRDNVIAGTDCGFGTLVGLRATQPRIAWAKLQTMAQGAKLASQRLW